MKNYTAPHMEIIEIDMECLMLASSPKYDTASASSSDGEVQVTYDGIGKIGIGDGGFLTGGK